jgi:hypothetical protein
MLRGAARAGVDAACLLKVEEAINAVEALLEDEVGNRQSLDAILSEWVHDFRAGFELRHKASAFRAMSALRGVHARAVIFTIIIHPSADPQRHDSIGIDAFIGCRRIRPSAVLRTLHAHFAPSPFALQGLDGQPLSNMRDLYVPDFSTVPYENLGVRQYDQFIEATIEDLPLGKGEGLDLVTAQLLRGLHRATRGAGPPTAGTGGQAEPPAEHMIVDALLHEDVWPGIRPELRLFDTVVRGITHPDDPLRQGDRLDMVETVRTLGQGPQAFRIIEFPRYAELIEYVCSKVGWDPQRLRGYRCKIRYPIYGCQVGLAFSLPERLAQG